MRYLVVVLCVVVFTVNTVQGQRRSPLPNSSATSRHVSHRRDRFHDEAVWTTWSRWTPCSFTCDRGVRSRYRGCVQRTQRGLVRQADSNCKGKPREYQMCEEQPCPIGSATPKEYQCAQKNKVKVLDKLYEWIPLYIGSNQCDLTCMASGHAFYNNFGHASDGTPCGTKHTLRRSPLGDEVERVCINGTCLAVGCDGMVDSGTRLDKCRVCGGENANCYHFRNSYMILEAPEEGNHEQYQDMVVIPEGATYVEVTDHSDNYLALADDKGTFILNGNWMIDWPGKYEVDNTVINYERRGRAEILTIEGPTTRKLILKLLFRERNPGVHYEFYIPSPKIDDIIVPEPHFKNKKPPTFIPPPLRPPRYGAGSGNVVDEVEEKVNKDDGVSVTRTTVRPTPKPRNRGVEIPLARILDDKGFLVEAKPAKTDPERKVDTPPEQDEAPPSADQVNDGIPWYLKAHRSEEFDDLVGGGIPLVKPNRPSSSSFNAQTLQYGNPLYHWPTANNGYNYALYGPREPAQGYVNPYSAFAGGDADAARWTNADLLNANLNAAGLLNADLRSSSRSAGFMLRNQYNPPPGGGPMTMNWDQFSSFPYSQPLLNAISSRANPSPGQGIPNNFLNRELLTAGMMPTYNGTGRNLAALYPGNRNPAVPPRITNPGYQIPLLRPQMPRASDPGHPRTRSGGIPGSNPMDTGLKPNIPSLAPTPYPGQNKLTNSDPRNTHARRQIQNTVTDVKERKQREQLRTSGRVTKPEVNVNENLRLYDVTRNPERGFIRRPQPAPVPPSYQIPDRTPEVGRTRSDASSRELPLGTDLPKIGARGYVLGNQRMSYLDYYKDKRNTRQAIEPLNPVKASVGGAYYSNSRNNQGLQDIMALDSGIPLEDSGVGTDALQAYDVPNLDKSIKRTLEITPEGERVILYDLTDVFEDEDPEDDEEKPFDPGNKPEPVVADDKYITDENDDVTDGNDVVENIKENDDGDNDNDNDDDDDADDDDDDSKINNTKPEDPDTRYKNIIEKKRDQEIFDYINEIIENRNSDSRHAVSENHRPTTDDGDVLETVTMATAKAELSTASSRTVTPQWSTSISTTEPMTGTGSGTARTPSVSGKMKSTTCPKCVRSRDLIKSYCSSDIVAKVTAHSSRIVGGQTKYKVTIGELYKETLEPLEGHFVWINNTCRCPKLRKNTDYLLMGKYANGRFTLDHESYAKKYKPSLRRRLQKITDDCPLW